jgi:hypothetical protein
MSEQEQHQYKFDITMNCRGCSGAVERVLKKLEGEASALPCPIADTNFWTLL